MPTKEGTRTGPSDPQAELSGRRARDRPRRTYGGVDANKPKAQLLEDAREAGIEGRSSMSKAELAEELQKYNDRETRRARERGR